MLTATASGSAYHPTIRWWLHPTASGVRRFRSVTTSGNIIGHDHHLGDFSPCACGDPRKTLDDPASTYTDPIARYFAERDPRHDPYRSLLAPIRTACGRAHDWRLRLLVHSPAGPARRCWPGAVDLQPFPGLRHPVEFMPVPLKGTPARSNRPRIHRAGTSAPPRPYRLGLGPLPSAGRAAQPQPHIPRVPPKPPQRASTLAASRVVPTAWLT